MHHEKVILGFAEELVPLVKDGSKTLTYRLGLKYDFLQNGDTLLIEDSSTHIPFAEIEIIEMTKTSFVDLSIDRRGHEVYSSKEEQRQTFERFYKKAVSDNDPVIIIEFSVLRVLG